MIRAEMAARMREEKFQRNHLFGFEIALAQRDGMNVSVHPDESGRDEVPLAPTELEDPFEDRVEADVH